MSEVETKQPKTTKEKVIFGLKIAGNVLFYAVIVFLFLFSLMNINSGGKGGIPNIFGKGYLSVQSDSMTRSDSLDDLPQWSEYKVKDFSKGDLIYVDIFSAKTTKTLNVGDVVTFYDSSLEALNTHRIVYINEDGKTIITQGDAKAEVQPFDSSNPMSDYNGRLEMSGAIETVSVDQIRGVVTGVNKGAGKVLDNIQQNWLIYFVVPVLILLLFEVFMVIKNIMDLKGEKQKAELVSDKDAMLAEIEAEKEKMRKELLAELMAQQQAQAKEEPVVEEKADEEPEVKEEVVAEEAATEEVVEETSEDEEKKPEEEENN